MTGVSGSGLRERHKRRTAAALRDAALERFESVGFDRATVEEIAERAGVSPRTFFRYFATKDAVIFDPYVARFDGWVESIRAAPPGRPLREALREASYGVVVAYQDDPSFWDRVHELLLADPTLRRRALEVRAGLEAAAAAVLAARLALSPTDLRPRVLAAAAMAAVGEATRRWYAEGRDTDRRAVIDAAYAEVEAMSSLLATPLPVPR